MDVVLVSHRDDVLGTTDSILAHKNRGMLHRAISVIIYRKKNSHLELLLQKRSENKLLWPLHWTNTVCTHPRPNETYEASAERRLFEEMGIIIEPQFLRRAFQMLYHAGYSDSLSEHELDTVFVGKWNGTPDPNGEEAAAYRWITYDEILKDLRMHPEIYTPWFKILIGDSRLLTALTQQ